MAMLTSVLFFAWLVDVCWICFLESYCGTVHAFSTNLHFVGLVVSYLAVLFFVCRGDPSAFSRLSEMQVVVVVSSSYVSHTQLASPQLNGHVDQFAFSRFVELQIDSVLSVSHRFWLAVISFCVGVSCAASFYIFHSHFWGGSNLQIVFFYFFFLRVVCHFCLGWLFCFLFDGVIHLLFHGLRKCK